MIHRDLSYDSTIRHLDLNVKVNDDHHFMTGNSMSTLRCYQVLQKDEARNDHKVKTGCFWYNHLYNPSNHKLSLEYQFESSDEKLIPNMIRLKTPTSKKAVVMVMGNFMVLM